MEAPLQTLRDRFSKTFSDVHSVANAVAALSRALLGAKDPGISLSSRPGEPTVGAPYSKPSAGKLRVRCFNWHSAECTVR